MFSGVYFGCGGRDLNLRPSGYELEMPLLSGDAWRCHKMTIGRFSVGFCFPLVVIRCLEYAGNARREIPIAFRRGFRAQIDQAPCRCSARQGQGVFRLGRPAEGVRRAGLSKRRQALCRPDLRGEILSASRLDAMGALPFEAAKARARKIIADIDDGRNPTGRRRPSACRRRWRNWQSGSWRNTSPPIASRAPGSSTGTPCSGTSCRPWVLSGWVALARDDVAAAAP